MSFSNHYEYSGVLGTNDGENDPDDSPSSSSNDDSDSDDAQDESARSNLLKIMDDLRFCAKSGKASKSKMAMSGDFDLAEESGLKEFLKQKEKYLAKKTDKNMTLLHLIAEAPKSEMPEVKNMKGLIGALVKLDENLLAERDHNGKTPLFCAIMNKNRKLAKVMCEFHHDINSILAMGKMNNPRSTNCIHEAITKKSSSRDAAFLVDLIRRSKADTLCAMDENGFTPLHLAVDFKRCDETQLNIVEVLVETGEKALDKTYNHPERGPLSPYLYHRLTSDGARQKDTISAETRRRSEKTELDSSHRRERHGRKEHKDLKGAQPREKGRDYSASRWSHYLQSEMTPTQAEVPTGKVDPEIATVYPGNQDISAHSVDGRTQEATSTSKEKDKMGMSTKTPHRSRLNPTRSSASEIEQFLKLHYLRNRTHDEAVRLLYGAKQDKQIYFDLFGTSPEISKTGLVSGLHHLHLEDILQYVAIPRVFIEDESSRKQKPSQLQSKPDGSGRTDMTLIFQWLREDKKVKTILKVIVDDLKEPSHSDEAIEACLDGMGVETWDWRKFDLSPDVIHKAAPKVRVVHLYWSGNNAVLLGWSATEGGLKTLKELQKVHLHVHQGLETRNRLRQNVAKFKKEVESGTQISVEDTKMGDAAMDNPAKGVVAARDQHERHKWVTSMEEFADFLQAAQRNTELTVKDPITIAIIDDGVDINDPNLHSRIQGGSSFCRRDEKQNLNNPYYVSPGGHGTAMARLICKICPNVKLHILRLDEFDNGQGKRTITAASAAKAVLAAVEEKVDIISMSWTIEESDKNDLDIRKLNRAIESAAHQNILMFCAAADQGAASAVTYPAASHTTKLFKIGAAEAAGGTYKWVGGLSHVDFIFPGYQVVTERHDDPRVKNYTALTGSSVATALASALAAMILYTIQIGDVWRDHKNRQGAGPPNGHLLNRYKSLKDHDKMREAFLQIGTTKESGHKYIKVWERFERKVKKAESDGAARDEYVDYIMDLADQLFPQL
ncbi:hypothetical protein KVR01_000489 [Diaporthe batatas]|uniref:uncharacterized protein n=1 Tax=Diaporthe batatas TaxID=748121 RepID=UPI001D058883|nr:uncharacterized protein KVR01_000489 [Diaporthe batatas]KAG8169744.1 hypothetical protein KVR01_000489 [Diaporthe batatas]